MALGVPVRKMTRFFAAGLPAALVALALNVLLVRECQRPKPLADPVVLVVQLSLNFMVCRLLVFSFAAAHPILPQYARFMSGMAMFRVADWLVRREAPDCDSYSYADAGIAAA
jgi:putative flippase GtrA